mmetsp:Transcript_3971/g.11064  ORF Transcript_3971/g.11064 Transcript_3971/m.11064 type:complete len:93 (-) Transcript_3971:116-394(-)
MARRSRPNGSAIAFHTAQRRFVFRTLASRKTMITRQEEESIAALEETRAMCLLASNVLIEGSTLAKCGRHLSTIAVVTTKIRRENAHKRKQK